LDLDVSCLLAGGGLEVGDQSGGTWPRNFTLMPSTLARSPAVGAAGPGMITARCRTSCLTRVAWRYAGEPEKMGVMGIRAARIQDVPQIAGPGWTWARRAASGPTSVIVSGTARRFRRWPVGCVTTTAAGAGMPLGPTGIGSRFELFEYAIYLSPLRNRTVDLLLTMQADCVW